MQWEAVYILALQICIQRMLLFIKTCLLIILCTIPYLKSYPWTLN